MAKTAWKQYTSKDRPYYVNSVTRETVVSLNRFVKGCPSSIANALGCVSGNCQRSSKS